MEKVKIVTIIVEAKPYQWPKGEITFEEVITLEFPAYSPGSGITYSVKYSKGPNGKPEGTLSAGGSVKVKEGMRFNVSQTGQS